VTRALCHGLVKAKIWVLEDAALPAFAFFDTIQGANNNNGADA
jgi:hypothetical protein